VDLGLKTGLALYGGEGRLRWYRSQNFGTAARLRRGAAGLLDSIPGLSCVVLEGGGPLAAIWEREAERRAVPTVTVSAETWRQRLLYPREQRSGVQAKNSAAVMARRVIEWSGAPLPTSLRDDAAEAILIGLWGVIKVGWLERLPVELRHPS
jgi:hypothetical protein